GEAAQRAAAGKLAVDVREEELAGGRSVVARERRDLLVEILEAEVDVEAGRVFAENRGDAREVNLGGRPTQLDPGRLRPSPCRRSSHPPFFPCPSTPDNNRKGGPPGRVASDATIGAPDWRCAPHE